MDKFFALIEAKDEVYFSTALNPCTVTALTQ